jgi:hypothetical protein
MWKVAGDTLNKQPHATDNEHSSSWQFQIIYLLVIYLMTISLTQTI